MARPRAADDFTLIWARMEELRRERAGVPEPEARRLDGERSYSISARSDAAAQSGLSPELRRMLSRGRST